MSNIKLSRLAQDFIYQTINISEMQSGKVLRLMKFESGLTLNIDSPLKSDRFVHKIKHLKVVVDKELEKEIGKAIVDISSINGKPKLVINKHKEA